MVVKWLKELERNAILDVKTQIITLQYLFDNVTSGQSQLETLSDCLLSGCSKDLTLENTRTSHKDKQMCGYAPCPCP